MFRVVNMWLSLRPKLSNSSGEMSEWFKEHAWKVCIRQKCIQGSNPCLSASPAEGGFYAQPKKKNPPLSAFSGLRRVKERWQSWFNAPDSKSDVL